MADLHRVVILGGGFAGLYAAQRLKHAPAEVTVIDKRNFHLFQPLLYQVATGALSPGEISAPIRGILSKQKNTRVLLGEVVDIDPAARRILLKDGAEVEYDTLVVATGSQSSYFGNDQWRDWAPPLKTVEDATMIRHKVLLAFEAAERASTLEERQEWLTFVIVGAGATGVELAGSLGEIANETLKHDFRSIRPQDARIIVVDGAPRTLMAYPEDLSRKAEQQLIDLGVRVRCGLKVTGVDANGVSIQTSAGAHDHIASRTVIWAAGVAVSDFGRKLAQRTGAETDRGGRIKVSPELTIPGHPEIFVLGDLASSVGRDGKPLPGVAQVAMQGGVYAANTILQRLNGRREIKPFKYFNKGDMAVIGRGAAVANTFGVHLSGFPAWLAWLFIHLLYLVEFQSRIVVLVQWGFLYLSHSRSALLITGQAATDILTKKEPLRNTVES
ncbi:MAG TPA: NAD(P)/FAD-dependent oxidoreductase [Verrucomicrobiae bacterium]|nr:NAD(P)/FAD-dependent oxidoreductase [Verrucomicrobiae bacterium]